ncbi:hypothetical protein ARALYDRAFT_891379 [Arabidopsis lyrata subsp. lyrata]|uniref:Uncharacterized protein n=1 Tax=Arabidopsis lyrata subsp. lyrata TaxID=81972 RepID=D7KNR3_ARALL|nr:hypothetical protein ARALYDRAFT_891379 [Arabidopsis lyrata subsp. lyrata]
MSSNQTGSTHLIEISTPPTETTTQIQDDYDEFKKAEEIFIALDLPKHTRFY